MIYIRKNLDNILHPNEAYTLTYLDNKGRLVKTTKEIDLYKICNQLYETKDLIDGYLGNQRDIKKVIHIQSEKDFRNQEISRYKSKLKEYEESSIER